MHNPPPGADEHANDAAQRRRRQAVRPRRQDSHFYSDEHPEIPLVRRASLHPDQAQRRPAPAQQKRRPVYTPPSRPSSSSPPRPPAARPRARPSTRHQGTWQGQVMQLARRRSSIVVASILLVLLLVGGIITNILHSQALSKGVFTSSDMTSAGLKQSGDPGRLVITPEDTDHPPPPVLATSAYLLDADTGATLYAHNPYTRLPMLSTTKLMTAVLAFEHGNLDERIAISGAISSDIGQLSPDSTVMGIKAGETYTLRELLYGLLLLSGNDAAIAIADGLAGSLPRFVAEMNRRAQQLGLRDTHYVNPHGLLATGHYSSALDLAVLARFSMSIAQLHDISGTETYVIPRTAAHPEHDLINGNQFLWWFPGVDGGKTGYDGASDFVQVISCTRNHHHLIGVVMHTNNWWTDMRDLMNWGFDNFSWISPRDVDSQQHPIPFDYLWNYFASDTKESTIKTPGGRYYIYTGYSVAAPFLAYFDHTGGLKHFGYPSSLPRAAGTSLLSQRFTQSTITCDPTTKQCSAR